MKPTRNWILGEYSLARRKVCVYSVYTCVWMCAHMCISNHYDTIPVKIQNLRNLRAQKRKMHCSGSAAAVQWFREWRSGYATQLGWGCHHSGTHTDGGAAIWIMKLLRLLWWVKGKTAELSLSSSWKCHASLLFTCYWSEQVTLRGRLGIERYYMDESREITALPQK